MSETDRLRPKLPEDEQALVKSLDALAQQLARSHSNATIAGDDVTVVRVVDPNYLVGKLIGAARAIEAAYAAIDQANIQHALELNEMSVAFRRVNIERVAQLTGVDAFGLTQRFQELEKERDRLQTELEVASEDSGRLDWLDQVNRRSNDQNNTVYGWKFDINHNRAALTDCNIPALTVREAIDAARHPDQRARIESQSTNGRKERERIRKAAEQKNRGSLT